MGQWVKFDPLYSINSQRGIRMSWNSPYASFLGGGWEQGVVVRLDMSCPPDGCHGLETGGCVGLDTERQGV